MKDMDVNAKAGLVAFASLNKVVVLTDTDSTSNGAVYFGRL